tara:strand:+ start:61 stop:435 length:375 start_codon:yes stop_codon:yes gene_type:complete
MASIGWADWVSMMGSFLIVLTLLVGTLIMIKKMGPKIGIAGNKRLQVLEVHNLGGRQKLVLVGVNQEQILIGISAQGMSRLGNFPNPPNNLDQLEVISEGSIPATEQTDDVSGFQGILSRVLKK